MVSIDPWPFDQPRNCAAFVTREVMDREAPILVVSHDADDHGWQFIGSSDGTPENGRIILLSEAVGLDPSVLQLADSRSAGMLGGTLLPTRGFVKPTLMSHQPSNHAVERTATRRAFTFRVARAFSPPATLVLGGRRSLYSR